VMAGSMDMCWPSKEHGIIKTDHKTYKYPIPYTGAIFLRAGALQASVIFIFRSCCIICVFTSYSVIFAMYSELIVTILACQHVQRLP
jgi:hypothetical protein